MNIGKVIQDLRKEKDLSQGDFAKVCNISQTYLSLIENDRKEPNISLLKIIAENLKTPLPFIFFLSIEKQDIPIGKQDAYEHLVSPIKSMIKNLIEDNDSDKHS